MGFAILSVGKVAVVAIWVNLFNPFGSTHTHNISRHQTSTQLGEQKPCSDAEILKLVVAPLARGGRACMFRRMRGAERVGEGVDRRAS